MERAERALFESGSGTRPRRRRAALDRALDELGWADALATDRATAVSVLFECLGTAHATSGALDRLLADALGTGSGRAAVVLPRSADAIRRDGAAATGTLCRDWAHRHWRVTTSPSW